MMTRSTSRLLTTSASRSGPPRMAEAFGQVASAALGLAVDEADNVESVLRVFDQLSGDQLSDLAGAQDQRVLYIRTGPPAEATRDGPHQRQGADRDRPERDQCIDARAECARQDVRRRAVPIPRLSRGRTPARCRRRSSGRVLLIGAIQALEPGHRQPARQRGTEDKHLFRGAKAPASPQKTVVTRYARLRPMRSAIIRLRGTSRIRRSRCERPNRARL